MDFQPQQQNLFNETVNQLAACCFGRRSRANLISTRNVQNQPTFYYSPSIAHLGRVGNTTTWPMTTSALVPSNVYGQAQPYVLFTQPVIIAGGNIGQTSQNTNALALVQQASPMHKVPSSLAGNQYAIGYSSGFPHQRQHLASSASIYATPTIVRNQSMYISPYSDAQQQPASISTIQLHQQRIFQPMIEGDEDGAVRETALQPIVADQQYSKLCSALLKRIEIIEKQVDLTSDMELVEHRGLVITRAIESSSLAPHLGDETIKRYHHQFLFSPDHIIRFIEIIKRPGQTLGLYIRSMQFETPNARVSREGIVITKIESDSPVYTSRVLHVGDEILSINLVDIQGMSLDDVVTLMSIPKRLVLALRVPRDRELVDGSDEHLVEKRLPASIAHRTYNAPSQHLNFNRMTQSMIEARQLVFEQNLSQHPEQFDSRLNTGNWTGTSQVLTNEQPREPLNMATLHMARPARVHTTDSVTTGKDIYNPTINDRSNLITGTHFNTVPSSQVGHHMSRLQQPTQVGLPMNRQLTMSESLDESRDEEPIPEPASSGRFQNFSIDQEIAKLERDAMNKDSINALGRSMGDDDKELAQISSMQNYTNDYKEHPAATLPRRTLPIRPNLTSSSQQVDGTANNPSSPAYTSSSIKLPIINSIRLGNTTEQSSYFSSSIEAINRELKELRRQRMALSNNTDQSVWESCSATTLPRMVSLMKVNGIIKDPRVEQALLKVDRAHYCPSQEPYLDSPHTIGYGATISAPHMHGFALEQLSEKLVDGAKVLDIGSGSGYLTACMAHMVAPTGIVYGVEHIKQLVELSKKNIENDCVDLLDSGRLKILQADGRIGLEEHGPFDVIHVGATAESIPEKLIEQLKEGGRMVLPVQRGEKQVFERVDKLPGGELKSENLLGVRYVPLTDVKSQLGL